MNPQNNWWKSPAGVALTIVLLLVAFGIAFFTVCTIMVLGSIGGRP